MADIAPQNPNLLQNTNASQEPMSFFEYYLANYGNLVKLDNNGNITIPEEYRDKIYAEYQDYLNNFVSPDVSLENARRNDELVSADKVNDYVNDIKQNYENQINEYANILQQMQSGQYYVSPETSFKNSYLYNLFNGVNVADYLRRRKRRR